MKRSCILLAALLIGLDPSSAFAQADDATAKSADHVDPFVGTYGTSVQVPVPAFRGLEPQVSLGYSSEGGNGFAGAGWSLSAGFDAIERASPGKGAPKYDANDIYLFGGEELIPCPTSGSVSPSCTTNGTHSTKRENHLRIKFDSVNNKWEVTDPKGIKRVYGDADAWRFRPTGGTTATDTFRYLLHTVTDRNNNTVTYNWFCDVVSTKQLDCQPDNIRYNGVQVTFHRELRPTTDVVHFATGKNENTRTQYRLISVDVCVKTPGTEAACRIDGIADTARRSALRIAYDQSPLTDRSRITEIQQYGKDALISAAKVVTGGTSMPPHKFFYNDDTTNDKAFKVNNPTAPTSATENVNWAGQVNVAVSTGTAAKSGGTASTWDSGASSTRSLASGDGYMEFVVATNNTAQRYAGFNNVDTDVSPASMKYAWRIRGDGMAQPYVNGAAIATGCTGTCTPTIVVGDVLRIRVAGATVRFEKGTTPGSGEVYNSAVAPTYPLIVDTSFYANASAVSGVKISGLLSSASGLWLANFCPGANDKIGTGDFNADGKSDLYCIRRSVTPNAFEVALSNGTSFAAPSAWLTVTDIRGMQVDDFNGDGYDDMALFSGASGAATIQVWVNNYASHLGTTGQPAAPTGCTTAPACPVATWASAISYTGDPGPKFSTGDYDGDGKADFAYRTISNYPVTFSYQYVALSRGTETNPTFTTSAYWAYTSYTTENTYYGVYQNGDLNGDGKMDRIHQGNMPAAGTYYVSSSLSTGSGFAGPWANSTSTTSTSIGNSCQPAGAFQLGDIDGDGKTDFLSTYNGTGNVRRVWLSKGAAFYDQGSVTGNGHLKWLVDVTGDGRSDIVAKASGGANSAIYVWRSQSTAFAAQETWLAAGWGCNSDDISFGDFNGDGKQDLMCQTQAKDLLVGISGNAAKPGKRDLIDRISSPAVSLASPAVYSTTISYVPSTNFVNTNNPPVSMVVREITSSNGVTSGTTPAPWSATTKYDYAGGLYDKKEHRSMGFRYVKTTAPCATPGDNGCAAATRPYTETWFKQDYGSMSAVEYSYQKDGNGKLWSATRNEYMTNGQTVPYTSLHVATWEYSFDGSLSTECGSYPCAQAKRKLTENCTARQATSPYACTAAGYDIYGNKTLTYDRGDADYTGDEKTTRTVYAINTTDYLTAFVAATDVWSGIGTGGTLLKQDINYYDGYAGTYTYNYTAYTATPQTTTGLSTKQSRWVSGTTYYNSLQEFDSYGNVTAKVSALGRRDTSAFDSTYHFYATSKTEAYGTALARSSTIAYNYICGVSTTITDLAGRVKTDSFDNLCRKYQAQSPGGRLETTSFECVSASGAIGTCGASYPFTATKSTDTAGVWSRKYSDGLGRTWRTEQSGATAGAEIRVDTEFDGRGNKRRSTDPYVVGSSPNWTTNEYDGIGRLTKTYDADGSSIAVTTSYALTSKTVTDEMGRVRTTRQGATPLITEGVEVNGGTNVITAITKDVLGRNVRISDPNGNLWTFTYNGIDQRTSMTDPTTGTTSTTEDADGKETLRVNGSGSRIEKLYDALGRITAKISKTCSGCSAERTVNYYYDEPRTGMYNGNASYVFANQGQLTRMTDVLGADSTRDEKYDYDVAGNAIKITRTIDGTSYVFETGHDADGRTLWQKDPDGQTIGSSASPITYDSAGRVKTMPGILTNVTYAPDGHVATQTNDAATNGTVTTYSYHATRGWLTGITTMKGTTTLQNLTYGRNNHGLITSITSPFTKESWTYGYDPIERVTAATCNWTGCTTSDSQTFTFDAVSNILTNSRMGTGNYLYAGGKPHAVTSAGGNTYAYDTDGRMTSGAGRTLSWNVEDQPVSITSSGTTSLFDYDGNGRRIKKTVGSTVTTFLQDDYEKTGTTYTRYVKLGGVLIYKRVGTTPYWLHTDHLGSVNVITGSTGTEVQRFTYRPYGEKLSTSTAHAENRNWLGRPADETGLVFLDNRYFDPMLARFISPDPVVSTEGVDRLNRYGYSGNDPINKADSDGHFFKKLFKKIGSVVKKVVKGVTKFVTNLPSMMVNTVKGIGSMLYNGFIKGDWRSLAMLALIAGGIIASGGLLAPLGHSVLAAGFSLHGAALGAAYVAASAGLGFVTGTAGAMIAIPGISFGDAVKAGLQSAKGAALWAPINLAAVKIFGYNNGMGSKGPDGVSTPGCSWWNTSGRGFFQDGGLVSRGLAHLPGGALTNIGGGFVHDTLSGNYFMQGIPILAPPVPILGLGIQVVSAIGMAQGITEAAGNAIGGDMGHSATPVQNATEALELGRAIEELKRQQAAAAAANAEPQAAPMGGESSTGSGGSGGGGHGGGRGGHDREENEGKRG